MSLTALTQLQPSSGEWVSFGLWSRRSLPPSIWVPSPHFTPYDPFVVLGPLVFVVPVSLLPPPPFSVQPYLSRYPPDQRESSFVVVLLTLSPSVPPSLGPVDLLNAVRAPFHIPPPPSYAMLVVLLA